MSPVTPFSNRRILIIDDSRAIHDDFRKILMPIPKDISAIQAAECSLFGPSDTPPIPHFEITSAMQGREGFEHVQQALQENRPYAMAFIDMRMPPGWDGVETISKIWEICPDLEVVICTAYSDYSWDEMLERVGQSDRLVVLKKPFDPVEVLLLASALSAKWNLSQQVKGQIGELDRLVAERTASLSEREGILRIIAENAADMISILDANGKHLYDTCSTRVELGYSAVDDSDMWDMEHVHKDDQQKVVDSVNAGFVDGTSSVIEYRIRHKDGNWRVFESHTLVVAGGGWGSPICDAGREGYFRAEAGGGGSAADGDPASPRAKIGDNRAAGRRHCPRNQYPYPIHRR